MSTKLINDEWTDMAIHATTDGGKSWTLLTEKWKGIHDPGAVAYAADTFVSLQKESAEFVSLSRLRPLDNKVEELKTMISTRAWSPSSGGQVLDFDGGYLVLLDATDGTIPANHHGIFFVPSSGDSAAAKLIWQAQGLMIGDFQTSESVIAIRTWNPRSLVARGKFAEQIHTSLDGGRTWKVDDVPVELLGGVMRLASRKVWLFTSDAAKYKDLSK